MGFWYYIVEDGKERKVTYEVYKNHEGKKYRRPYNYHAKFLYDLLASYR